MVFECRDLKPENLLLAEARGKPVVKVADFGLSKMVDPAQFMNTACGTPAYVGTDAESVALLQIAGASYSKNLHGAAPEVLLATGYGPEVDMWAIGVITYIILSGVPPFFGESVTEIFDLISVRQYISQDVLLSQTINNLFSYGNRKSITSFPRRTGSLSLLRPRISLRSFSSSIPRSE